MIKKLIFKYLIAPKLVKSYTQWYFETIDWKKNDWRNWVAEEFERLKKSRWTLRNYPNLRNISFEDLVNSPISEKYIEASDDFPGVMKYVSTGTVERKTIKFSKSDTKKIILGVGRHIWLMRGEARFRNALMMGSLGLASGTFMGYVSYMISRNFLFVEGGKWRKHISKIIKNEPYDLIGTPLPYYVDFLRNFNEDIYWDLTFWIGSGDIMTSYLRNMVVRKGQEFNKIFYPVDTYGASECIIIGMEVPPNIVNAVQYAPETNILLLKKEDGSLINIFDAKPGDIGELLTTPLFDYMVPNYPLNDIVEIVEDETKFGLPSFRILGRKSVKIDLDLHSLGHLEGYFSMYTRVMGVIINGYRYTNFLGEHFETDHITLIKEKEGKVLVRTYVERKIDINEFLKALKNDKELNYLYEDISSGIVEIEFIKDPEVVNEVKMHFIELYGPQATIPRVIILKSEP